jgi:hypothetical protein
MPGVDEPDDWQGWVTTGRLGIRMRGLVAGSAPLVGAVSDEVASREPLPPDEPLKTEPCSSSHSESIRDERRPVDDDDELRREADDRLAIRPRARIAVPVF